MEKRLKEESKYAAILQQKYMMRLVQKKNQRLNSSTNLNKAW